VVHVDLHLCGLDYFGFYQPERINRLVRHPCVDNLRCNLGPCDPVLYLHYHRDCWMARNIQLLQRHLLPDPNAGSRLDYRCLRHRVQTTQSDYREWHDTRCRHSPENCVSDNTCREQYGDHYLRRCFLRRHAFRLLQQLRNRAQEEYNGYKWASSLSRSDCDSPHGRALQL